MGTLHRNLILGALTGVGRLFTDGMAGKSGGALDLGPHDRRMMVNMPRGAGKHNNRTPYKPRWIFLSSLGDGNGVFKNASSGECKIAKIGNVGGEQGRKFSFHAESYLMRGDRIYAD